MTWKIGFLARCRARAQDEHGFSLVETMVAIGVIFGSLLVLGYTATIGFGYESLARQRQSATGVANQVMEQSRGLAYSKIQTGMLTSDLAGDPNVVTGCPDDDVDVYRFLSCTPGEVAGSGEKIVHSSAAVDPTTPLVPHVGTFTQNNIDFTTRAYVTNDCPTINITDCLATDPYRVTVLVTWTGGRTYPTKLVRIQSLFYSPTGCRSPSTHPFAAPCQPYFFGTANVPGAEINVTGEIQGIPFDGGDLLSVGADSSVQHEQLSQAQASYTATGVQLLESTGTSTAGSVTDVATAADTDPGSPTTSTYGEADLAPTAAASVQSPSGGGTVQATFGTAGGDTASARSTTSAGVVNVCPPPPATGETDAQPCAAANAQQGGALSAVALLDGFTAALGEATIAKIEPPANPSTTFVNHTLYPATGICSPVNGADGCIEQTATRRLGTVNIGGLPSVLTPPTNWSGANAWNGYLVSIVGYEDQASAPVGRQVLPSATSGTAVPAPSASVTGGTIYYWNPLLGTYSNVSVTDSLLGTTLVSGSSLSLSQVVNAHTVSVNMSIETGTVEPATPAVKTTVDGAGNLSRTESSAQVTPPKLTVRYEVWVDGNNVVALDVVVNLKTMEARGVYGPAPLPGS
jgi:type II secretory pathway pseudopilin PulG